MKREDVRNIGNWVFVDKDYNILFEGPFDEANKFSKNAPNGLFMSKRVYEQFKK
jgi:hypothetical protein